MAHAFEKKQLDGQVFRVIACFVWLPLVNAGVWVNSSVRIAIPRSFSQAPENHRYVPGGSTVNGLDWKRSKNCCLCRLQVRIRGGASQVRSKSSNLFGQADRCRISLALEQFGWESVGGSSWRYPALGQLEGPDDYFGQVAPALWYFRSLVAAKGINVTKYLLHADSEAYYRDADKTGHAALPIADVRILASVKSESTAAKLSERTLRRCLHATEAALAN